MHMASTLITPLIGGSMYLSSGATGGYCVRKIKEKFKEKDYIERLPMIAAVSAGIFAAQMVNFTIPYTGSSGHIVGGVLLSALFGPEIAFLAMAAILTIQCVLFGDGGLMALGCNIMNMGFISCFIGYNLIYKKMVSKNSSNLKIMSASILSNILALQLGAMCVSLETLMSGITELPFTKFIYYMQPIHLVIGLAEGVLTGVIMVYLSNSKNVILKDDVVHIRKSNIDYRIISRIFIISLIIGGGISLFASKNPDGLEWSISKTYGIESINRTSYFNNIVDGLQEKTTLMPDYYNNFTSNEIINSSISGMAGVIVTFGAIIILGNLNITKKRI